MLEVCVDRLQAVRKAIDAGAQRIELSENLSVGGVTPSADLIQAVRGEISGALIVLVRCREGDFQYTPVELDQMLDQAQEAIELGADGVAVGACCADGSLDWDFLARVQRVVFGVSEAAELVVHRAFDRVPDPVRSIERLIELRYDRILTSGGALHAVDSLASLREWNLAAGERLEILPAGGIHSQNAERILHETQCRQLHGSFTKDPAYGQEGPIAPGSLGLPIADQIVQVRRMLDRWNRSST
ncbi:MAG: copper homeostasis protein CutC [Planctomycetota bacterium]|nr:copper homeostasis protein CutC [Planctomycetota bacterium]